MNNELFKTLQTYSHLNQKNIFNHCIQKLDKPFEYNKELTMYLNELNSFTSSKDIYINLTKLEANIALLDLAFYGFEATSYKDSPDFTEHCKAMNIENLRLLRELFVMLENKINSD